MNTQLPNIKSDAAKPSWTVALIVTCLVVLVIWASKAEIDEVVRGTGNAVPRVQTQLIQNLEGGIVQDILVAKGDTVEVGQVIVQMNDAEYQSGYQELLEQSLALQIRLLRLEAEANMDSIFEIPEDLRAAAPETARSELDLFYARAGEFSATTEGMSRTLELQTEEVALLEPMAVRNAIPKVDFIRAQLALSDAERNLNTYLGEAETARSQSYAETLISLGQIDQQLSVRKEQLDRTTIYSPVNGTVNTIYLNTLGGVVGPGEAILEILPHDDDLQIEGRIDPKDIGFVYVGMPATVKLTAFDFAIYGTLSGEVVHVSANTVEDTDNRDAQPYYEVLIKLSEQTLTGPNDVVQIRPGMQTQIELESGSRTVLEYLVKPLFRATDAFSER